MLSIWKLKISQMDGCDIPRDWPVLACVCVCVCRREGWGTHLHASSVFVPGHTIHFIHNQTMSLSISVGIGRSRCTSTSCHAGYIKVPFIITLADDINFQLFYCKLFLYLQQYQKGSTTLHISKRLKSFQSNLKLISNLSLYHSSRK